MKRLLLPLIIIALLIAFLVAKPAFTGEVVLSEPSFRYRVLFCDKVNCTGELKDLISNSSDVDCAMYNFDPGFLDDDVKMRIVTDDGYKGDLPGIVKDGKSGLMHNKFCIFNSKSVITGSFNPSSSRRDRNNMIFIESGLLARNYEDEFNELWNGNFGNGSRNRNPVVVLGQARVENYFCPEDDCSGQVISNIQKANSSILFMAYSFTHRGIANSLMVANVQGKDIRGVIDSSSDKAVYEDLKAQKIDVRVDSVKGLMHHKVFIIDNTTVITGSFNPTNSGDKRNDENILVIHDRDVASEYLEEFDSFWKQ
ncbi:hypothetical protein HYU11_00625 [Candidatus Woesearchaeota archaeon]|nr:hypothetical protein [Candidatus Woesearchaeota archaeon]